MPPNVARKRFDLLVPGERIELPTNGLQNASGKDSGVFIGCHPTVILVE
jgi:hypothetical protein